MDSKTLWTVIVTALIVALLTSLITVKLTGNIIYTPSYVAQNQTAIYTKGEIDTLLKKVNAVSCNGDSICETSSIRGYGDANKEFWIGTYSAEKFNLYSGYLNIPGNLTVGGYSDSSTGAATLNVKGNVTINKDLTVRELDGSGNAFVCVGPYGKFFRSSTPCTTTSGTANNLPSVSILSPKNQEIIKCIGTSVCIVNIKTTATDNSGIRAIDFFVDGKYNKRGIVGDSNIIIPNFDCNKNSAVHSVYAKVIANDDEVAESATITFSVTGCPP